MVILIPFFIIFAAGLLFTSLSSRLHLPYVTALIVAGILIGDSGLKIIETDPGLEFLGFIGLIFLMFMAGSQVNLQSMKKLQSSVIKITAFCTTIPFFTGFIVGYLTTQSYLTGLLLGVLFISSSVAVVIPFLDSTNLIQSKIGKLAVSTTVVQDIISLFILAIVLQMSRGETPLSILLFLLLSIIIIIFLKDYIPKIHLWFLKVDKSTGTFESELRFTLVILFSSVILFELIGLHAIVAAFIIGLLLSDTLQNRGVLEKVRTISYGIFIPIFFFIVGMQTDLSVLTSGQNILLTLLIVISLIVCKQLSGWLGGRFSGLNNVNAHFIGVTSIPQLSTTLAVAFTALDLEIIDNEILTALVILVLITSLISPIGIKYVASKISKHTKEGQKSDTDSLLIDP